MPGTPWWYKSAAYRNMMTSSNGNIALLALCEGNLPVTGEVPSQRQVMRSFDDFVDLCLNKRLSKQSRRLWFERSSRPLWRHCNETTILVVWGCFGRYVTDGIFKGIFVNINVCISTKISPKWVWWFNLRNTRKRRDEIIISIFDSRILLPQNHLSCLNELCFLEEMICYFVVAPFFRQNLGHWTYQVRLVIWQLFTILPVLLN